MEKYSRNSSESFSSSGSQNSPSTTPSVSRSNSHVEIASRIVKLPHNGIKWEEIVKIVSKTFANAKQLEDAINEISGVEVSFFSNYFNGRLSGGDPQIQELNFFEKVLPCIQKLVLRSPVLFPESSPLEILFAQDDKKVVLKREQVACLLANAFFCTFHTVDPVPKSVSKGYHFPEFTFENIYLGNMVAKVECIMHYFERVSKEIPKGFFIVHRRVLIPDKIPNWAESDRPILKDSFIAHLDGNIEDSNSCEIHADFANEYIGGGVLHGGNVQEEILFVIKPECLVTLLFCAKMDKNETIWIKGAERYSNYKGYGASFRYTGDFKDPTPFDTETETLKRTIVAFDAIVAYSGFNSQFSEKQVQRDLLKCYCAFMSESENELKLTITENRLLNASFATGNWGCGAFGGDFHLKIFQQLLSAAQAKRKIHYYTFKKDFLEKGTNHFVNELVKKKVTVGKLYKAYIKILPNLRPKEKNLFEHLLEVL